MRVKSKILQKIYACFALICFVSTLAPAPGVFADTAKPAKFPSEFGTVRETFHGTSSKSVILIQDAHANYDAQTSIRKLIDHFQKKSGINFFALEGGSGPLDLELLRAFPDQKSKEFVMDEYVRAGELSGAEMAAVVNITPSQYVGIEDAKLYEENKKAFFAALDENEKNKIEFSKIHADLEARSLKIDSPELRKLRTRKIEVLADLAKEQKIDIKKFPGLEQIIDALKEKLFQSEAQRALDREFQRFETLERISRLEATREDVRFFASFLKEFKIDLKSAVKFYDLAFKRDQVLSDAVIASAAKQSRIIFVGGGFHTDGIKQKLKQAGISYQIITPIISSVGTNQNYLKVMRGEVSYASSRNLENEIAGVGDDDAKIVMRRKLQEWRMRFSGVPTTTRPILDRQLGIATLALNIQTKTHPLHRQFLDAASLRLLIRSAQTTKPKVTIADVVEKLEAAFGRSLGLPDETIRQIAVNLVKQGFQSTDLEQFIRTTLSEVEDPLRTTRIRAEDNRIRMALTQEKALQPFGSELETILNAVAKQMKTVVVDDSQLIRPVDKKPETLRGDAQSLGVKEPSKEKLRAKIALLENLQKQIETNMLPELVYFGDKHGEVADLEEVVAIAKRARARGTKLHIIGHGDGFDRGLNNAGVWRIFRELQKMSEKNPNIRVTFLLGNHEVALIRDQLFPYDGNERLKWRGGMGGDTLVREFNKKFGSDEAIEKLKELALWILERVKLYEIDEAGILHVHAGIPVNESGMPAITLNDLKDWQEKLEIFQKELRARSSLTEKESWLASRGADGFMQAEGLLELFMEFSRVLNVRPDKWLDLLSKKQLPYFLTELGVNGIVVGHQRAETLRQHGGWIFLIDAGVRTNDHFLTLSPAGLVWYFYGLPLREVYNRNRLLTLIGNEIAMLQSAEASSLGARQDVLEWLGEDLWKEFTLLNKGNDPAVFSLQGTPQEIKSHLNPAFENLLDEGRGNEYAVLLLKSRDVQASAWKWLVVADRVSEFSEKTALRNLSRGIAGIYSYELVVSLTVYDAVRADRPSRIYLEGISVGRGDKPALRGKKLMRSIFANRAKILEREFPGEDIGAHAVHFVPAQQFAKYYNGRIKALHDYDEHGGHKMYFSPPMPFGRMGKFLNPADPADLKTFIENIEKAASPGQTAEQIFSGTELVLFGTIKGNSLGDEQLRRDERGARARSGDATAHLAHLRNLIRAGRWLDMRAYFLQKNLRSFHYPDLETYFDLANRYLAEGTAISRPSGIQFERTLSPGAQPLPGDRTVSFEHVALSLDGNTLILGSNQRPQYYYLDVNTGERVESEVPNIFSKLSPDGRRAVVYNPVYSSSGSFLLWDMENKKELALLAHNPGTRYEAQQSKPVCFSANGFYAAVRIKKENKQFIQVFETEYGKMVSETELLRAGPDQVPYALSPDGKLLITTAGDRKSEWALYDLTSGQLINHQFARLSSAVFSPDGEKLAITSNKRFHLYPANSREYFYASDVYATHVSFTKDGSKILATDSRDGVSQAVLMETETGTVLKTFSHRKGDRADTTAVLHPSEQFVLTAGNDRQIRIWDIETGEKVNHVTLRSSDRAIRFFVSPDGSRIFAPSGGNVDVFRIRKNSDRPGRKAKAASLGSADDEIREAEHAANDKPDDAETQSAYLVALNRAGRSDDVRREYAVRDLRRFWNPEIESEFDLAMARIRERFDWDNPASFQSPDGSPNYITLPCPQVRRIAERFDGKSVVFNIAMANGDLRSDSQLINLENRSQIFGGPNSRLNSSYPTSDGRRAVVVERQVNSRFGKAYLSLWNFISNRRIENTGVDFSGGSSRNLVLSPNDRFFASNSWVDIRNKPRYRKIVFSLEDGKRTAEFLSNSFKDLRALSPDGRKLIVSSDMDLPRLQQIQMLDVSNGSVTEIKHWQSESEILFSPHGDVFAVISSGIQGVTRFSSQIYDTETGTKTIELENSKGLPLRNAQFSPDGKYLAVVSNDHSVMVWKVSTGRLLHRFRHSQNHDASAYAFHPGSSHLITAGDDRYLRVWNLETGKRTASFRTRVAEGVQSIHVKRDAGGVLVTDRLGRVEIIDFRPKAKTPPQSAGGQAASLGTSAESSKNKILQKIQSLESLKNNITENKLPKLVYFGDKHGDAEDLERIVALAKRSRVLKSKIHIIGHGDGFDRGSDNLGVWQAFQDLTELAAENSNIRVSLLFGNHDLVLIMANLLKPFEANRKHWHKMGGRAVAREFREMFGRNNTKRELLRLALWMLEHFKLYEVDEAGILHVHAGIPVGEDGKPAISLEQLESWQKELDFYREELSRRETFESKLKLFFEKSADGLTHRENLIRIFEKMKMAALIRAEKWIDPMKDSDVSGFLAELGVNAIMVGHDRHRDLKIKNSRVFLIDVGGARNTSHLILNRNGFILDTLDKRKQTILSRGDFLKTLDDEIRELKEVNAKSLGNDDDGLRKLGREADAKPDNVEEQSKYLAALKNAGDFDAVRREYAARDLKRFWNPVIDATFEEAMTQIRQQFDWNNSASFGAPTEYVRLGNVEDPLSVQSVAESTDGLSAVFTVMTPDNNAQPRLINLENGNESAAGPGGLLTTTSTSPDARRAAIVEYSGNSPSRGARRFSLWNLISNRRIKDIRQNNWPIDNVVLSPNGRFFAFVDVQGRGNSVYWTDVYSMEYGEKIAGLSSKSYGHLRALSPDGRKLIVSSIDKILQSNRLLDVSTGRETEISQQFEEFEMTETRKLSEENEILFSPSGDVFAGISNEPLTYPQFASQLYDSETGAIKVELAYTKGRSLRHAQFSPDGQYLAAILEEHEVAVYEVATGRLLHIIEHNKGRGRWVLAFAFHPDSSHLITAGADRYLRVWSLKNGMKTASFRTWAVQGNESIHVRRDASGVIVTDDFGTVEIIDLRPKCELPQKKLRKAKASSLGADEIRRELRLTMNLIHVDKLEDPRSGKLKPETAQAIIEARKRLREQESKISELTQIPDELSTALANARGLLQHAEDRFIAEGGKLPLASPAPKPASVRSPYASSVTREPGGGIRVDFFIPRDFEVKLFDRRGASAFAFHPHYNTWTIGFEDGIVEYLTVKFNAEGSKAQISPESVNLSSPITAVAYDPSGDLVAAGTRNGNVIVWDSNKAFGFSAEAFRTNREISSLAFNPNGKDLAIGTSARLMLWDFKQPYSSARKLGDSGVRSLAYSSDGSRLAVLTDKMTVELWDLSGQEPKIFSFEEFIKRHASGSDSVFEMTLRPDGNEITVMLSDRSLRRFNVKNPASPVMHMTPQTSGLNLMALAYRPDGNELAAIDDNWGKENLVRWNLRGPGYLPKVEPIVETKGRIQSIAYRPDGQHIACLSADGVYFCIFPNSSGKSLGTENPISKKTLAAEVDRILAELAKIGAGSKHVLDYLRWHRQKNLLGVEDAGMLEKSHAIFRESLIRKHPDFVNMLRAMLSYLRKKEQLGAAADMSLVSAQVDRGRILAKINNRSGLPVFSFIKDKSGKVTIAANPEFFDPTITDIYVQTYLKALRRLAGENPQLAGFLAKKTTAPKYFDYFALSDFKQFVTELYHKRAAISSEELSLRSFEFVRNYVQSAFNNERESLGKKRKFALADKKVRADYRRAFLISKYTPSRIVPLAEAAGADWNDPNVMILDDVAYRVPEWRAIPGKEDANYPGEIVVFAHWKKMFFFLYVSRTHTALKSPVHQWRSAEMFLGGRFFVKNDISENMDDIPGHLSTMLDQAIYDQRLVRFEGPEKFNEFRSGYLNINAALAGDVEYPKFKAARLKAKAQSLGGLPKANEFLTISPRKWIGEKLWNEFKRVSGGEKFQIVHMAGTFDELSFSDSSKTLKKTLDKIEDDPFVLLVVHNQYDPNTVHHVVVFDRLSEINKRESLSLILLCEFPNSYFEYGMQIVAYDKTEQIQEPFLVLRRASLGKLDISPELRGKKIISETIAKMDQEILQKKYPGLKIEGFTDQYAIGRIFLKFFNGRLAISGLSSAPADLLRFLNPSNPSDLSHFLDRIINSAQTWDADVTTFNKQFNVEGRIKDASGKSLGNGSAEILATPEYQKLESVMEEGKKIPGNFSANSLGARQTAIRLLAGKDAPDSKEMKQLMAEAGVISDEVVEKVCSIGFGRVINANKLAATNKNVVLAVHVDSLPDELSPKAIQILLQIKKLILVFPQGNDRAERIVELVGRNVKRMPYVGDIPVRDIQRELEKERDAAKGFLTQNLNLVSDRLKPTREKISYFELDGRQYRETLAENALALILNLTQNPALIHEWQGVAKAASLGNGAIGISFDLGALVEKLTVINSSAKSLARAA